MVNGPENAPSVLRFVRAGLAARSGTDAPLCSVAHRPPTLGDWAYPRGQAAGGPAHDNVCRLGSPETVRRCFTNQTIMLLGDSTARDVALAMGSWLGGLEAEQAETNRSSNAHGGGPAYESRHPSRAGIMSNASFADKADGGCGSHTIEALNLTVTHCAYWNPELMPAMLKRAAATCATRCATVAFVLFGAHYLKISPVVHQWVHSPDVYIHGKVFQPFLDFWCAHSEGRAEAQVPLVWLPLNPRCKRNLDPRIQSQMAITAGANSASLHMAEVMRFPYVDINRVFARVPIPSRSTTSVSATSRRMGSTFRRQSTTCGRTTCSRSFATSAASSGACRSTSDLRRRVVHASSNRKKPRWE